MIDFKKKLGLLIKIACVKKGITQKDLSIRLGKNSNYIASIVQGLNLPNTDMLIKIAKELELDIGGLNTLKENIERE
jgi:transcriptional regulator with XRE-family HTH domain